jgi:hypothetical protein
LILLEQVNIVLSNSSFKRTQGSQPAAPMLN